MKLIEQNSSDQSGGLNERPEFPMQGKETPGKARLTIIYGKENYILLYDFNFSCLPYYKHLTTAFSRCVLETSVYRPHWFRSTCNDVFGPDSPIQTSFSVTKC